MKSIANRDFEYEKEIKKKRDLLYLKIRVTGGLGSWMGKRTTIFFVNLDRPYLREEVRERIVRRFAEEGYSVHVSTPITPESVSYAVKTERRLEVREAWNMCVEALEDLVCNSKRDSRER